MVAIEIENIITTFNKIPNKWNDILNYNSVNNSEMQIDDGWREIINPSYNTATQKLGDLYLSEPNYTYEVIELTAEELATIKDDTQESNSQNSFFKNIQDGRDLFEKSYKRMYRRFKDDDVNPNNILTLNDVKKVMRWNKDCYTALNQGNFYRAENIVLDTLADNATELGNNRPLEKMFEWLRDQIQDYILNEYDLV